MRKYPRLAADMKVGRGLLVRCVHPHRYWDARHAKSTVSRGWAGGGLCERWAEIPPLRPCFVQTAALRTREMAEAVLHRPIQAQRLPDTDTSGYVSCCPVLGRSRPPMSSAPSQLGFSCCAVSPLHQWTLGCHHHRGASLFAHHLNLPLTLCAPLCREPVAQPPTASEALDGGDGRSRMGQ
jgi:hypothetical protein